MNRPRIVGGAKFPLPRIVPLPYFEECTVAFGVAVQWGVTRYETHHVWVQVELPPAAADALCVVWPGHVALANRWESLRRLLGREGPE